MRTIVSAVALAGFFLVTACAKDQTPVIEIKETKVAVPVPCTVDTKNQRPKLMTLAELQAALAAAPNVDSKAIIVSQQLLMHMGWVPVLEGAIKGCQMAPKSEVPQ